MSKRLLTVVTPVFNEEEVIHAFYERTKSALNKLDEQYEARILFVVDRCTDNTVAILKQIAALDSHAQVLTMSARFGHQMALLAGIDYAADADVIVMMDSDLQHPPELIPELLRQHDLGNDIVFTVRMDTEDTGRLRKAIGSLFYRLLGYLSEVAINENAADFRLVSRRVAKLLRTQIRERNMFLRGLFSWIGFNQKCVEYAAAKRAAGQSKYSFSRMTNLAIAGILSFSTKPLKIGIFIGVCFATFSFVLIIIAVIKYFVVQSIPDGWTTMVVLLLLFSGIQLIVLGIMGTYIGGIYEEVKGRPRYIIDEIINTSIQDAAKNNH
jgi:glycosyltransferase involved in cell wall biosynthesis